MADRRFDAQRWAALDDVTTVGGLLEDERARRGWGWRQLAFAIGMSYEKYQRVKADADLPSGDELLRVAALLGRTPLELDRHVKAAVVRIVERTLGVLAKPQATLRAARRRGPDIGDADAALIVDLPPTLRATMAEDLAVDGGDAAALAAALRQVAARDAMQQALFARGMAALVELEGVAAWMEEMEALLGDDDALPS